MKSFLIFLLTFCTVIAEDALFSPLLEQGSKAGQTSTNDLFTFAYVPAGDFQMGSPKNELERAEDENQVAVKHSKPFLISVSEVTQGQWKQVMGVSIAELIESKADSIGRGANLKNKPSVIGDEHPMCYVSYDDALEFCAKLTETYREAGVISETMTVTLPTEAQWEYAARAGTTNIFTTGNTFTDKDGCFLATIPYGVEEKGDYKKLTTEVKSYPPNAWGIYDMNGNMYEWCLDWYTDKLPGGTDPAEMTTGDSRNIRGGTWNRRGASCRNAYRYSYDPSQRTNNIGFRVIIK